ncbi:MAG TPA: NAD(P)-dependent oxidoreductase [Solirubrobacterales bacterium]|nr:NAD(P)-dependent oxidoreductase [Solirubrobacterales bacterium]
MKVFVAGATGAIGRRLVPELVARGHDVVGMTRSESKRDLLRELGATPAVADALDADAVGEAVSAAEPEVIVHELTAIPDSLTPRRLDRDFETTNRLRTEGTNHLLSAARGVGARRFVAQSFAPLLYERSGGPVKSEDDPVDPDPLPAARATSAAIRHVERAVTGADWIEGLVLRYGGFYGPGTSIAADPDTDQVAAVRAGKFPIVGAGTAIWSFIHIDDAAAATAVAVERGAPGIYNVTDDEPAPVSEWLPGMAEALGAKPPRRVPKWLGRIVAGRMGVAMMTELRGASNAKAKRELGWEPRYPSWRQGFAEGLS